MRSITGREHLRLTRHRNRHGHDQRDLLRRAFRGELTKLRCGAFVETALWASLSEQDRVRLEVAAAHDAAQGRFIASHASAAALWEVPRITDADGLVHSLTSMSAGTRTNTGRGGTPWRTSNCTWCACTESRAPRPSARSWTSR